MEFVSGIVLLDNFCYKIFIVPIQSYPLLSEIWNLRVLKKIESVASVITILLCCSSILVFIYYSVEFTCVCFLNLVCLTIACSVVGSDKLVFVCNIS